jgi:thioredoxin 1
MDFDEILKSEKPILVDFWAEWCGPCKMMNPVMERIKEKREDIEVVKINVDENRELAMKYQIRSIPTLVVFKEGVPIWRNSGVLNEDMINHSLKQILN